MPSGRVPFAPIYVTPKQKIEVIGEGVHVPTGRWRCRIRPHPLFGGKVVNGGIYVWRNRVVLTERLGRKLLKNEHAHHKNGNKGDDRHENIEMLTAAEHNREHKTGSKHRPDSKEKTSRSLKAAYASGMKRPQWEHLKRDSEGKFRA